MEPLTNIDNTIVRRRWLLFVAGNELNSRTALKNLERLRQHIGDSAPTVDVIDVTVNYEAAMSYEIVVTPALIQVAPEPKVVILGSLSDRERVLTALGIQE